jgi:hypothetical protein
MGRTKKTSKTRTIYVPLPVEIADRMDAIATRELRSLGQQAALAIKDWLDSYPDEGKNS